MGKSSTNGPKMLRHVLAQVVVQHPQLAAVERHCRHHLVSQAAVSTGRGTVHVAPVVDVEMTTRASPTGGSGRCVAYPRSDHAM